MKKTCALLFALVLIPLAEAGNEVYSVESAVNVDGSNLIVNGIEFAAKGYCRDYQFGDNVVFLSGDPNGTCTDALLMNLRNNESCDVWCQYPL